MTNCAGEIKHGFLESALRGSLELNGLNALVVGLGLTGRSVAGFLSRRGAIVTATDKRLLGELEGVEELRELGVTIQSGTQDAASVRDMDLIVVSPGVSPNIALLAEARSKGVEIISDIELASRFMTEEIIAVAGTNGKTTTVSLLGSILADAGKSVFVGGNIGTPVLDSVEKDEVPQLSVLEVSSFQLEGIDKFKPHTAVLLNITEDHLYRYADFDDYAQTKFRIFMNQHSSDFAIMNMDDPAISSRVESSAMKARLIELRPGGSSINGDGLMISENNIIFLFDGELESYSIESFRLIGYPQGPKPAINSIENIMAVIACARIAGINRERIIESINSFTGLSHRMEFVRQIDNVTYINDSKATNPASVIRALEGTPTPVVLIAGGKEKGCDYSVLADIVKEKVRTAILCGEAGKEINKALYGVVDTILVSTFDEAVGIARTRSEAGDTVLLSPACSSFDEFESFSARGERFKLLVEEF